MTKHLKILIKAMAYSPEGAEACVSSNEVDSSGLLFLEEVN